MTGKTSCNILVRGVNWIGDAVMTMPALKALRIANPGSRITLLVRPWVSPLFEKSPDVDEIIIYEDKHKGFLGKFGLAGMLKKKDFRMAVLFQNAMDAAVAAFFAGIPERIGYARDGRRMFLTKAVPFDSYAGGLHHIEYYLNLLEKVGFAAQYSLPWLHLSLDERLWAREKLEHMKRPVIAINPGAAYGSSKRWRPERFAEIAKRVINGINGSVIIFGGPSEREIEDEIAGEIRKEAGPGYPGSGAQRAELMLMAGKTGLRELAALISESDLLVTNDSGPMHMGYATGAPVAAIFGSTSPALTGPAGRGDIVISKAMDCAPCFERECKKGNLACMDAVSTDEVFDAIGKLVGSVKAVFFDRDGTICRDAGYLSRMADLEIFPEVKSLSKLKENGFLLIGVTNQSGIDRGMVKEDFVKHVNNIFMAKYGFDGFYYCPHHPDKHCSCRKPEPGMLLNARADYRINLKGSFVVGDKELDMLLAKAVGAKGIHVRTGQECSSLHADFHVNGLNEAVSVILGNVRGK